MQIKGINICICENQSMQIFNNLAQLLYDSFRALGINTHISHSHNTPSPALKDWILPNHIHILLAVHNLGNFSISEAWYSLLPRETTVIINTEPLAAYQKSELAIHHTYLQNMLLAGQYYAIWDYARENIPLLQQHGIEAQYLPLGYTPTMHRIVPHQKPDIDVLFYGLLSPYRSQVLRQLQGSIFQGQATYLKVATIANVWGAELDSWIARSKVVVNIHSRPESPFEIVRCSYLMNNGIAVVSEDSAEYPVPQHYRDGIVATSYENITVACIQLCRDDELLAMQRQRALSCIQRYPQTEILRSLLQRTFNINI